MNFRILSSFIEEAENALPSIREKLLAAGSDGFGEQFAETLTELGFIAEAAVEVGEPEIAELSRGLADHIRSSGPTFDRQRRCWELLGRLEASLLNARMKLENGQPEIYELPGDEIAETYSPPAEAAPETGSGSDDFEIDQEMMEIFRSEADELLKSIGSNLRLLAERPDDRDALWEIRRNAHTFKGAAGIIGLKEASRLAHRVEDMLDHMTENNIGSNRRILDLITQAMLHLASLTGTERPAGLSGDIDSLYEKFDHVMEHLSTGTLEVIVEPAAPAAEPHRTDLSPVRSEPAKRASSSVVRVSLERLDDLVKIIRGLVVSRSSIEQRLRELDLQLDELRNSSRRLRSASDRLEIDFGTSLLKTRFDQPESSSLLRPPASAAMADLASFDTLELDRYSEFHLVTRELAETASDTLAINVALDALKENLDLQFDRQRSLVDEMQEKLLRIRMVEFGSLSSRLSRAVSVTCEEENKKASLVIENEHLEIDTQILDSLIEPLIHLLRNSVVHGIEFPEVRTLQGKPETGEIRLRIFSEETHIVLTVSDDGRGMSPEVLLDKAVRSGLISNEMAAVLTRDEILDLIFLPGLTTAEKLTMNAGRGVGVSIVKDSVESCGGTISVTSEPGRGTKFSIRMPLSLAVTNALLVKAGQQTFAFPLGQVKHILEIAPAEMDSLPAGAQLETGGERYPFDRLSDRLGIAADRPADERGGVPVLLVETFGIVYALAVDKVLRTEELVIKEFIGPLSRLKGLLGSAILGSGEVVPILDLSHFLNAKKLPDIQRNIRDTPPVDLLNVLIVDDSPSVRHMTSRIIQNAGWQVQIAKDGIEALELLEAGGNRPDIILTDVEMPRMDGFEMLAALKTHTDLNDIPVIMITSRAAEKHRQKAWGLGVSEYLVKPFQDSELVETIKVLCGRAGV